MGDFSQTRTAASVPIAIYDPFTTRSQGTGFVRDPFPGSVIPATRIDPVSRIVTGFYPKPNLPGTQFTQANNFIANASQANDLAIWQGRIDHLISEKNRLFLRY